MEKTNVNSVNEVDLISLFKKVIVLFYKRRKFILYSFLIGLLLGLAFYIIAPKEYKSRMIISSNLLRGPAFMIIIDDLERHVREQNYAEVAQFLDTDIETAKKIKKIQVFSARSFSEMTFSEKLGTEDDDDESKGEYIIEAFVADNKMWPVLQIGLLKYLGNNEFSKLKSIEKKNDLKRYKDKIHNELQELDSLKYTLSGFYKKRNVASTSNIYISDPSSIYNNILHLYQAENKTATEIQAPDVSIIQGFVPFKKQTFPKLFLTLLVSLVLTTIFVVFVLLFQEAKKRISLE